jgi:hypothetical protein
VTSPVVVVTRDSRGETEVRWYDNTDDCDAGRHIALVRRRELYVDGDLAEEWIADMAFGLFRNELRTNRHADLSWLATHRYVGGALEPAQGRAA